MSKLLENFYNNWSEKPKEDISYISESAIRKSEKITEGFEKIPERSEIGTILDFGCGYGEILNVLSDYFDVKEAHGFDFSEYAIEHAKRENKRENIKFHKLASLDNNENFSFIRSKINNEKVDCVLLIDLLEHVPNCLELIALLSKITKYFIVKLPIEASIFNNYVHPKKEYPSPGQSDGHLREFTSNDVHYFIRKLGLNPIFEEIYVYHANDILPPPPKGITGIKLAKYYILKYFKIISRYVLPKKMFLRLIGGGGYWCFATHDEKLVLEP